MRDFIWVLDPENDYLFNTLLRLKDFANQLFEFSTIRLSSPSIKDSYKAIELSGTQRRNILLIFKEAMNNALKYSQANQASLTYTQNDQMLEITFVDDGLGFDPEQLDKPGYGLKNMRSRAEKIGAGIEILSNKQQGQGTKVTLQLLISQMEH